MAPRGAILCVLSLTAFAAVGVDYYWLPSAQDLDGNMTNAVHFFSNSAGTVPVDPADIMPVDRVTFNGPNDADYVVSLPAGTDYTGRFSPCVRAPAGRQVTLDFRESEWSQSKATNEEEFYTAKERFQFYAGSYELMRVTNKNVTNGVFRFSDMRCTVADKVVSEGVVQVDFLDGVADFYSPGGAGYVYMLGNASIPRLVYNFHEGSTFKMGSMLVYANSAQTNEYNFLGGTHLVNYLLLRGVEAKNGGDDTYARTTFRVSGADTELSMWMYDGPEGQSYGGKDNKLHGYNFIVEKGGTFTLTSQIIQYSNGADDSFCNFVFDGGRFKGGANAVYWNYARVYSTNSVFETQNLNLYSGTFRLKDTDWLGKTLTIGRGRADYAALVTEGGTLTVAELVGFTTNGTARLSGDGTRVVPAGAISRGFIRDFSSAQCGANGLIVDSDEDIVIPQNFENIDGAVGELVLAGSGVKTLSGTSTVSRIVAVGGTVVFAEGARAASELVVTNGARVVFEASPATLGLTRFACGDGVTRGVVVFRPGTPIDFPCLVSLDGVGAVLEGSFAIGSDHVLATLPGGVSSGSAAAWDDAWIYDGDEPDRSYEFLHDDAGGTLRLFLRPKPIATTITLGVNVTSNATTVASCGRWDLVKCDVASGAALDVSATVQEGGLAKCGAGRMTVTGTGNELWRGLLCLGGVLSVSGVGPFGVATPSPLAGLHMYGGTFEYSGGAAELPGTLFGKTSAATDVIDLKVSAPLTVNKADIRSGCIVKRGAGTLTFSPGTREKMILSASNGCGERILNASPVDIGDLSADPWPTPSGGYYGFNVAEGEVVFSGPQNAKVIVTNSVGVGLHASNGVAEPRLVVDGVHADLASASTLNLFSHMKGTRDVDCPFPFTPTLEIRNGADVYTKNIRCHYDNSYFLWPTVTVDNATWTLKEGLNFSGSDTTAAEDGTGRCGTAFVFRNGAKVYASSVYGEVKGWCALDLDNATFAKNEKLEGLTFRLDAGGGFVWRIGNGALLALDQITLGDGGDFGKNRFTLSFNGGTWKTKPSSKQPLRLKNAWNLVVRTESEAGLALPVDSGATLYASRAIQGPGGVVKTGDGTLCFERQAAWTNGIVQAEMADPVTLAFGGTLDVREGLVVVSNGCCRAGGAYCAATGAAVDFCGNDLGSGATFAGGGTFRHMCAAAAKVVVPLGDDLTIEGVPIFDGVSFAGPVVVDFGRKRPPRLSRGLVVVARFSDGSPDVSSWRARGLGGSLSAVFRMSGSSMVADICHRGFTIRLK